ncbi:hypothetical protein J6590_016608 [Homalodisca vitripennis]|nr:hypothetical protein J6590_016608 [Homalodisca vitripennis]
MFVYFIPTLLQTASRNCEGREEDGVALPKASESRAMREAGALAARERTTARRGGSSASYQQYIDLAVCAVCGHRCAGLSSSALPVRWSVPCELHACRSAPPATERDVNTDYAAALHISPLPSSQHPITNMTTGFRRSEAGQPDIDYYTDFSRSLACFPVDHPGASDGDKLKSVVATSTRQWRRVITTAFPTVREHLLMWLAVKQIQGGLKPSGDKTRQAAAGRYATLNATGNRLAGMVTEGGQGRAVPSPPPPAVQRRTRHYPPSPYTAPHRHYAPDQFHCSSAAGHLTVVRRCQSIHLAAFGGIKCASLPSCAVEILAEGRGGCLSLIRTW